MNKKIRELAKRYGRKTDMMEIVEDIIGENYHVSAFTNPDYPVITEDEEIQVFKWGLIPFWVKTEETAAEIRKLTYNAKAETIFEKPSFRTSIKTKRCLIPSTGYFDWRHEGNKRIPYYIFLKNEEIFSMAGIYDEWIDQETRQTLFTFSIITTKANPLTQYIHNAKQRMPVILSKEEEEKWLLPHLGKKEIEAMLTPYDEKKMDAYILKNDFIRKNPHDPSILEKAGILNRRDFASEKKQGVLS